MALTLLRVSWALLAVTEGLGTSVHAVPFQCSVTVWSRFCSPTAHASVPLITATEFRLLSKPLTGCGT
jgi:hypothetical protein